MPTPAVKTGLSPPIRKCSGTTRPNRIPKPTTCTNTMKADIAPRDVQSPRSKLRQNLLREDASTATCSAGTVAIAAPLAWSVIAAPGSTLLDIIWTCTLFSTRRPSGWGSVPGFPVHPRRPHLSSRLTVRSVSKTRGVGMRRTSVVRLVLASSLVALGVLAGCDDSDGPKAAAKPSSSPAAQAGPISLSLLVFNVESGGTKASDAVIADLKADVVGVLESYNRLPKIA